MQINRNLDNLIKGFKAIAPVSPERVEAMAQDALKSYPATQVQRGPSKINGKFCKVKWTLHYLWKGGAEEPDTFESEELARAAQHAYETQHAPAISAYTQSLLEALRAAARLSLQSQRDDQIKRQSNAVARVTIHDAKKMLSRM